MNCNSDLQYSCSEHVRTISTLPLLFGRKKIELQSVETQAVTTKSKPSKPAGFPVAKYDIAEDKLRFFNKTGLSKKRWIVTKEFPIYELTKMEHRGNWLSLSWNDQIYSFILNPAGESFAKLVQQITELQEAHQKYLQKTQQAALHKSELLTIMNTSLLITDGSFDILMDLHKKRVNWPQIEQHVQTLGNTYHFKPQTLLPLTVDFSQVAIAVQNQTAQKTAQETFNILKIIWTYFNELQSPTDLTDISPNVGQVRNVVLAYFTLNDLWFANILGEADTQNEFDAFRHQLTDLTTQTQFGANTDEFFSMMENTSASWDICDARILFRERLKQL